MLDMTVSDMMDKEYRSSSTQEKHDFEVSTC
jgi:hypothetical protein